MTRKTKIRSLVAALTGIVVVTLAGAAGCGDQRLDLEGVPARDPQKFELYTNIDTHPNIARQCIDGVAFATTSREFTSVLRVPEWDAWCKS